MFYNTPKKTNDDKRAKIELAISIAEKDIERLEESKKKVWREIKDFVHSYEFTADGEQRIHNITKEINHTKGVIKKHKKLLADL